MVRVRRPSLRRRTVPGEYIVSRAEAAKHADPSLTYKEIARQYGINERTLRKLRTGETSGRRIFRQGRKPGTVKIGGEPTRGAERDLFTIHYEWWYVVAPHARHWASVNAIIPRRTLFDVFALKNDPKVIDAVAADLAHKAAREFRRREGSLPSRSSTYLDYDFDIDSVSRVALQRREPLIIYGTFIR